MKKSRYTWKSTKLFDPKRHALPIRLLIKNGKLPEKLTNYGFKLHLNPVTPGPLDLGNFTGAVVQLPLDRVNSSLRATVLTPNSPFSKISDDDRIDLTDALSSGNSTELFVFGHYMEEKDKYIYFESGNAEDSEGVGCGSIKYRVSKDIILHFEETGETCDDLTDNVIQFFF